MSLTERSHGTPESPMDKAALLFARTDGQLGLASVGGHMSFLCGQLFTQNLLSL